ncbi:MAG TPA: FtsX-like permease family protein [Vicinamibacterales bacterium]|nr:FtsX-like permease family protein [Vicinamibacterales bacterium]
MAAAVRRRSGRHLFTWLRWTSFAVRTHGEPLQYATPIRRALAGLDPNQPVYQVAPLEQVLAQSVATRRFNTLLLDLFAGVALLLAAVGVYGTIGYWVAQRTREIGIRMALGATRGAIATMVVGKSAALTVAGVGIGIGLAMATTRLLSTLLVEVSPVDPLTFAAVSAFVTFLGIAAAYIPARCASRLDPVQIVRGV